MHFLMGVFMSDNVVAVILAAGKGTRMRSSLAKVLHPLLGRPLMAFPVDEAKKAGVENIVAVIGHQGDKVREAFAEGGLSFAVQSEQKGTGHAVLCSKGAADIGEGIALILCGDVPLLRSETIKSLLDTHRSSGKKVTVLSMKPASPKGYGRLISDGEGNLKRIVEERDATFDERKVDEVNTGTYAITIPWLWQALGSVGADNSQGEYYLTDIVALAAKENGAQSLLLADPVEAMGINDRGQLAFAAKCMRQRINAGKMEEGVTFEDPENTYVEPGVEIAAEVTLAPLVRLCGETKIGSGTIVGQGSVITDTIIGEDVLIRPYCVMTEAIVGNKAQVGPFAHLRPRANLHEGAKVGNFVEMKNSVLGEGSKASHLTYLGDAEIGKGANIGAGTITCNYDGVNKSKTIIGDNAFIGSNASLVAPVTIANGAVVGAGSTITKDVEEGSLGISRAKQRSIAGWKRPQKKDK